jgi:hypothetical protein
MMKIGLFAFAELLEVANKRAGKQLFTTQWVGVDEKDVEITTGSKTPIMTMKIDDTLINASLDGLLVPGFWTSNPSHVERVLKSYQGLISALKTSL